MFPKAQCLLLYVINGFFRVAYYKSTFLILLLFAAFSSSATDFWIVAMFAKEKEVIKVKWKKLQIKGLGCLKTKEKFLTVLE